MPPPRRPTRTLKSRPYAQPARKLASRPCWQYVSRTKASPAREILGATVARLKKSGRPYIAGRVCHYRNEDVIHECLFVGIAEEWTMSPRHDGRNDLRVVHEERYAPVQLCEDPRGSVATSHILRHQQHVGLKREAAQSGMRVRCPAVRCTPRAAHHALHTRGGAISLQQRVPVRRRRLRSQTARPIER